MLGTICPLSSPFLRPGILPPQGSVVPSGARVLLYSILALVTSLITITLWLYRNCYANVSLVTE